jgi:pyridinium-3,5-bisthiocarboxylic acid mononucleotide nickel chelatase
MKILYIDPIFGLSGDMMISAFVSAGLPFEEISALLKKVPLQLPAITAVAQAQGVIEGIHLNVQNSDLHLSIAEMESVMAGLDIEEKIKQDAQGMLEIVLNAESKIHGIGRNELHLHELSNVDTIIDLLCVAKGMHYFGIDKVYCGPVPCGRGTIKTAHGIIPNPPPVTLEILSGYPLVFYDEPLELTTPTGATIVRHYVKDAKTAPAFTVAKTGYGVGTYKTTRPDALRIFIATSKEHACDDEVWVIECDLDDMEIEYIGAVADRIRNNGARDVLYFPVFMKKGRPGIRFSAAVSADVLERVIEMIFQETTTFGMRLKKEGRRVLKREEKSVETSYGPVRVKNGYDEEGKRVKTHVEFQDVKNIAEEKGLPYRVALEAIKTEISTKK